MNRGTCALLLAIVASLGLTYRFGSGQTTEAWPPSTAGTGPASQVNPDDAKPIEWAADAGLIGENTSGSAVPRPATVSPTSSATTQTAATTPSAAAPTVPPALPKLPPMMAKVVADLGGPGVAILAFATLGVVGYVLWKLAGVAKKAVWVGISRGVETALAWLTMLVFLHLLRVVLPGVYGELVTAVKALGTI